MGSHKEERREWSQEERKVTLLEFQEKAGPKDVKGKSRVFQESPETERHAGLRIESEAGSPRWYLCYVSVFTEPDS